jgi:serine O-acetyltransferase
MMEFCARRDAVAWREREMKYDGQTVKEWAGNSQWRAWRADFARYRKLGYSGWGSEGFWALTIYRMQRGVRKARPPLAWLPVRTVLAVVKKMLTLVTHINIHPDAMIGPGLIIPHVGPIQVFPWAQIGADCAIHQVCTIGAGSRPGGPKIGDHVMVGCHTCILGPVEVGDGAKIGAGAVVVSDIPAGATAVGVPARALARHEALALGNCS